MSAETCGHVVPAFGCQACIKKDKTAILAAAIGTTLAPACPDCGGPTKYYESDEKAMVLSFACIDGDCDSGIDIEIKR